MFNIWLAIYIGTRDLNRKVHVSHLSHGDLVEDTQKA